MLPIWALKDPGRLHDGVYIRGTAPPLSLGHLRDMVCEEFVWKFPLAENIRWQSMSVKVAHRKL